MNAYVVDKQFNINSSLIWKSQAPIMYFYHISPDSNNMIIMV